METPIEALLRSDDRAARYRTERGRTGSSYEVLTSTYTQTPGQFQKVDPPQGSIAYTIGVLESRLGGSTF